MSYLVSSTSSLHFIEIGQGGTNDEYQWHGPDITVTPIHILDDDSLLNIFYLYRPAMFDRDDDDYARLTGGDPWDGERWWYTLAHVCQRWWNLILGSASYLGVCLLCTNGTPVADMLAQSPTLPLIIDYLSEDGITAEDERAIVLALEQRDRIRRIRLVVPYLYFHKLAMAIDGEYPILEHLILVPWTENTTVLVLPETLQAPHLRHLMLSSFAPTIGSRLLTTAVGLVTLYLEPEQLCDQFSPSTLVQWLSFMSQLEMLAISFLFPVSNRDAEGQPIQMPNITHITLPNLRWFAFEGVSTYFLEAVVRWITAPRLEKCQISFIHQLTYSIPRVLQFLNTTENLRLFEFEGEQVSVQVYLREDAKTYALLLGIDCSHLNWQVSSVAQICDPLNQIFSPVEHLILKCKVHSQSSEEHNEVDLTKWRKLLRSFSNVRTLSVEDGLVGGLSRWLQLDDGEPSLELLPELQELRYVGSGDTGEAFTSFVQARQSAGRPVSLIRC